MREKGKECVFKDTMEHTRLILKVRDELYPIRSCAIKTILERARVSGNALNKVQKAELAQILNYCMKVAGGDALLRFCEDKISAVHGGDASDDAGLGSVPYNRNVALKQMRKMTEEYTKE